MHCCTSVILLVVCYSAMTSFAMQSGKYSVMTNSTGAQVCSTDKPSQVLPMCPGGEVQCGMQCLMSSCPYYQFKSSTPIQCELYDKVPWNFTSIANCIGYSRFSSDCSFPFTNNGLLYNGCIPNGATGACFSVNRTTILPCKTNTVIGLINDTVSIGEQPVPVQSIFGWIIWMRRTGTAYDWNLPWASYKNGIGSFGDDNYWLGLERVSQLTSSSKYRLRIEVKQQSTTIWRSVEYWSFTVGNEASNYTLNVDGFSGDTGNAMQFTNQPGCYSSHFPNGMMFSTYDSDNDIKDSNCASLQGGGWWSSDCGYTCPTCYVAESWWTSPTGSCSSNNYLVDEVRMMMKPQ